MVERSEMTEPDHWAVTVWRNGIEVVSIGIDSLSGKEIEPADKEAIRNAARNLLAFIGEVPGIRRVPRTPFRIQEDL
jgi:hypothetical protein